MHSVTSEWACVGPLFHRSRRITRARVHAHPHVLPIHPCITHRHRVRQPAAVKEHVHAGIHARSHIRPLRPRITLVYRVRDHVPVDPLPDAETNAFPLVRAYGCYLL